MKRERNLGSAAPQARCHLARRSDSATDSRIDRQIALWLLVVACLAVGPTAAQVDPGSNSIGIYFDEAATVNCLSIAPGEHVTAYLVVTRPEAIVHDIGGFECSLLYDPGDFPSGIEVALASPGTNYHTPPSYQVAFDTALLSAPTVPLLRLSFTYWGGDLLLGVGPAQPCSFGLPCLDIVDGGHQNSFLVFPSSNVPYPGVSGGFVVAGINAGPDCPVALDASSWGRAKTLYDR